MSEAKEIKSDLQYKDISNAYLGYLVGQVKEVLEASVEPKDKCSALKNIIADKIYHWWTKAGYATDIDETEHRIKEGKE